MGTTNKRIKGGLPDLVLSSTMTSISPAVGEAIATTGTATAWPDGSSGRSFVIEIEDEAILVSSRSANNLTVEQRGYDDTSAAGHQPSALVRAGVIDAVSLQSYEEHLVVSASAHQATAIAVSPAGTINAVTVQAAIQELDGDIQNEGTARTTQIAGLQAAVDALTAAIGSLAGAGTSAAAVAANLVTEQGVRLAADNALDARLDIAEGAWSTYGPAVRQNGGASITVSTNTGRYHQVGKTVMWELIIVMSGAGASGAIEITLPVAAREGVSHNVGQGMFLDASASKRYNCPCLVSPGDATRMFLIDDLNNTSMGIGVALAAGDQFVLSGMYEAA